MNIYGVQGLGLVVKKLEAFMVKKSILGLYRDIGKMEASIVEQGISWDYIGLRSVCQGRVCNL